MRLKHGSILLLAATAISGCSETAIEEFTFRKLAEHDLQSECGENTRCQDAVSAQIAACMERANWRGLLDKEEGDPAFIVFNETFRPCFVEEDGKPLL